MGLSRPAVLPRTLARAGSIRLAIALASLLALAAYDAGAAAAASPYQTAVLGSTPSSYLRLGESTGTTAANAVTGAAAGTYGSGVALGKVGADSPDTAVQFGGTGYVTVADGPDTGPTGDMALEAWVKPASVGAPQAILEKFGRTSTTGGANNSLDGYQLRMNANGTVVASLYDGTGGSASATSGQPLAVGQWAHVVASDDGSALRLYVNGQLAGSTTVSFGTTRSPNPLFVGAASGPAPGSGGSVFSGRIDEVAVYDRALTATEVSDHFSRAVASPEVVVTPQISGNALQGATLSATSGTWSPPSAPSIGYQWQRCTSVSGGCTDIAGATASTYVATAADAGKRLAVKVTATNSAGAATATSATTAAVGYAGAIAAGGPTAYLRLGEATGATTARNEVAGAVDGSYVGGFSLGKLGVEPYDLAPQFQGGYVSVADGPQTAPTGSMTLEVWMKPNAIDTTVPIVEKYGHTSTTGGANNSFDGYQLRLNAGGTVTATLYGSAGATVAASSTQPLEAGRWAHLVAAADGTALRLYVNGQATASTLATFGATRSPNPLSIGASSGPAPGPVNNRFWGRLDEVAIYGRSLSASEVADHFSRGVAAPELYNGPIVSGIALPGSTMSVSNGTWSPAVLPAFTYQWQRCRYLTYSCTDIPGATAQTYVVTAADNGYRLTSLVTATNSAGSASKLPGASTPVGYGASVTAAGVSAYYRLGDPGGTTATVELGGGSNGTYGAGAVLGRPGVDPPDTSVQIGSGAVSVPDLANNSPTGDMSVEAWAKPAAIGTAQAIVEKYGHNSTTGGANDSFDGYRVRMNADGTVTATLFGSAGGTVAATSPQPLSVGRWAHLAAANDGTTLRLYVNGQAVASAPVTFAVTRSSHPLYIGAASGPSPGFGGSPFSGRIDEVAIYDSGLSAAQVTDHFTRGVAIPELTTSPQVTGSALVGSTLSVSTGAWSPAAAPTMSYQWQRCTSLTGGCSDIAGATGSTYVVAAADAGKRLTAKVTATNSAGSASTTPTGSPPVGYGGAVMAANPSAYFRFGDPNVATAKDEVAGAPDGTYGAGYSLVSGVDPPDTALLIGSAPASIADSPATSPTGDMSVEAWVKPATMGTAQSIVEKYGHTSTTGGANNSLDGYGLRMNGDGTVVATLFAPDGTTAAATSALPLTLGRWAHLVAADDGMALRLYVNGQLAALTSVAFATTRSPNALAVGAASGPAPGASGSAFSGRIDEVALYDRALTAAEVADHLARAVPAPEKVSSPSVTGTLDDASTLTADPGVWSPVATPGFAYQWSTCPSATGSGCTTIAGATSSTYAPTTANIGSWLTVRVTASNSSGSTTTVSSPAGPIHSFDTTDPVLTPSGDLYDQRGGWVAGGTHALHLSATDGTASAHGSGVTALEVKVDGSREAYWSQSCPNRDCSMDHDYVLDASTRTEGSHDVVVSATDAVGHTTTRTWTIRVDKTPPTINVGGPMWDSRTSELTHGPYDVTVSATDGTATAGSGVRDAALTVDSAAVDSFSQACQAGGCDLVHTFTYANSGSVAAHAVVIRATDQAGNEATKTWAFGKQPDVCPADQTPAPTPADPAATASAVTAVENADPAAVAASQPSTVEGQTVEPSVTSSDAALAATNTISGATIAKDPNDGFAVARSGSEQVCLTPVNPDPTPTEGDVVNGDAVVYPATDDHTDTVVRPTPTGVESFTTVKSGAASEDYSWKVQLTGDEQLRQTDDGGVQVLDPTPDATSQDPGQQPGPATGTAQDLQAMKDNQQVPADTELPDPGSLTVAEQAAQGAGDLAAPPSDPAAGQTADAAPVLSQDPAAAPAAPADAPPDTAASADAALQQAPATGAATAQQNAADDLAYVKDGADLSNAQPTFAEDGKYMPVVVAEIRAPDSTDAAGHAVPTTLSADGDTVTMHVDHQDNGFSYPIVADPWVTVVKYSLNWHCCRPAFRREVRVRWEPQLTYIGSHWSSLIWQSSPRTSWGNGWYSIWSPWVGWILMPDWGWSPMYTWINRPVYYTVDVFTGWESWLQWDTTTELQFVFNYSADCQAAFGSDVDGYRGFCLGEDDGSGGGPALGDALDSVDADPDPTPPPDPVVEDASATYTDEDNGATPPVLAALQADTSPQGLDLHASAYGGSDITPTERALCYNPGLAPVCAEFQKDGAKATALTERLFRGKYKNSPETKANAFQHVFWTALMMNSFPGHPKWATAEAAAREGDKHKAYVYDFNRPHNDPIRRSSRMDYMNDKIGLAFGEAHAADHNDEYMCSGAKAAVMHGHYIGPYVDPWSWARKNWDGKDPVWRYFHDKAHVAVKFNGKDCSPA